MQRLEGLPANRRGRSYSILEYRSPIYACRSVAGCSRRALASQMPGTSCYLMTAYQSN